MNSVKRTVTISQAANIIAQKQRVALFAHTNPDGDTIGATVALYLALTKLGKTVAMFCDMPVGDKVTTNFDETRLISDTYDNNKYDLFVAVDCGDLNRLGTFGNLYRNFAESMTIDHHGGDYFSRYNLVVDSPSTCQLIHGIVTQLLSQLDSEISTYLYMGLCTDTGNFSHNNTNSDCFLTAAKLCQSGADIEKVNRVFFKDRSLTEMKLLGRAISHMRTYYDGQMVLMYLTLADLKELNADMIATSGIVQSAIDIDVAKVGVMLTEA